MRTRRIGLTAALTVGPIAAWRFAQAYRARAGYPHRHPPEHDPRALGLAFEELGIPSGGVELPAWWIPARGGATGPAVLLIHGWESARDRTLPNALVLNAAGFHVLTLDVRGHGANPPEELPLTAGEFGADALAGVQALLARTDVTTVGILGHSMGGIGALLAAAAEPRVAAVVAASTPADPYRLTRQTFRLARLPLPGPLAYPLAWLTTHVFLEPRGHTVRSVSASHAVERYGGPILLVHGDADRVVPIGHLARLERSARRSREDDPNAEPVDVLVLPGAEHSWLYEYAAYRGAVARFFAQALGGPLDPAEAEAAARAVPAARLPQREHFSVLEEEPGGMRTLVRAIKLAGANRAPVGSPRCYRRIVGRVCGRGGRHRGGARDGLMDVWTAIRTKRMVRRFEDRPLVPDHLTRIVDAGRHAGSSKNKQRWDFVVVEQRDGLRRLSEVGPFASHVAGAAAAVALVTPDPRAPGASLSLAWDVGLAAENMMLAAWELGVGSCPATVYEQAIAREVLGYPEDGFCGWILSFGYPADPGDLTRTPLTGGRRPLDDVVHRERW